MPVQKRNRKREREEQEHQHNGKECAWCGEPIEGEQRISRLGHVHRECKKLI